MKRWLRWLVVIVSGGIALLGGVALAQDEEVPLSNWGAPPYWTPPVQVAEGEPDRAMAAHGLGMTAHLLFCNHKAKYSDNYNLMQ